MNEARFDAALAAVLRQTHEQQGIGTLGEKTLHAVLKRYYEPDERLHEVRVGRFVADIAREDGIIEIQTRNFGSLREKLAAFLPEGPVTLVYPIARLKWLCWLDPETGEVSRRRKSPKTGEAYDAGFELYRIRTLLTHPNLRVRLVFLELTEYRYLDGWSRDRKRGSTRCERIPGRLLGELELACPADYAALIPPQLTPPFTTAQFAAAARLRPGTAQKTVGVLYAVGLLRRRKQGRAYLYEYIENGA